ncbi:peptide chain release factor N(5)-glutamine methyltransferase [Thiomonas sp. X19]|uniref:peptide chain release factor N(5)-glutamine methyltransferase n=1 Tax=Thiomonas sp. X19 TaxID=1050370 RepID=UPI002686FDDB
MPMTLEAWMRQAGLARIDALVLLRELAGISHATLLAHPEALLDAAALKLLDAAATRLRAGEPLAYVLGWREFYGLRFTVSPAVLVPRPETELLVDFALARMPHDGHATVLDLGTGSGAIAVAVAHARPQAEVWAVDSSADALKVAAGNAQSLLPQRRPGGPLRLLAGDWFAALPMPAPRFDLILGNPPYVAAGDAHLAALAHEPQLALVGRASADGLADIRRIVATAPAHLAAGGWLALEHGHDQAAAVQALLLAAGLMAVQTQPDLAGIARLTAGHAPAWPKTYNSPHAAKSAFTDFQRPPCPT